MTEDQPDENSKVDDKGAWASVLIAEAMASGRTRYNPANIDDDVAQATKYRQKKALAENGLIETKEGSGRVKLTDRTKELRDKIVASGFPYKLRRSVQAVETALDELPDDVLDDDDSEGWSYEPSTREKLENLKDALEQLREQSGRRRY